MALRSVLNGWFVRFAKPTVQQWQQVFQTFWSKDEDVIQIEHINGLGNMLNGKADQVAVTSLANNLAGKADLENGKIPHSQIPDSILGANKYKGLYNSSTNIIVSDDSTLNGQGLPASTADTVGWYLIMTADGTVNAIDFKNGDWIISNGVAGWNKVDNTDSVTTVAGRSGAIILNKSDVGLPNVPNVDATAPGNIQQSANYRFTNDTERGVYMSPASKSNAISNYKRSGNTVYDLICQYTGEYFSANKATAKAGGDTITDADVDSIIYFKIGNEYFQRNFFQVNVKWFGAKGDGV